MGIGRLWTYVKSKKESVVTYVDLVEEAKRCPGGMKILVDFYCWEHFMKDNFWKSMTQMTDNSQLMFDGGEYKDMDKFIKNLVQQLRSVNIDLVFYLDGAKGSAYMSTKQKMQTWKNRYFDEQKRLQKYFEYLRGQANLSQQDLEHITRPCLQEVQNVLTLQEAGCEIHLRVSGEADFILAKHMKDDERAFCVFSNDTDFLIFPDSVYLSMEFFDIHNDLGLGQNTLDVQRPGKLTCGVIKTVDVIRLLDLPNHHALIELAIIGGNDFTSPFLHKMPQFKQQYWGNIERLGFLVRHYGTAEQCEFFGPAIAWNAGFREAVKHSREFYTLTLADEEENQTGYIFSLIAEGIRAGKLPSTIVSMHRGIYWHRQILEDPSPGSPTAEGILSVLRSYVYKILLPYQRSVVTEIGRTPDKIMDEIMVRKAEDPSIPTLAQVKKNNFFKNLHLFEIIIQHQEMEPLSENKSFFKLYGRRMGFLCFLLRYFLLMNWQQNLYISIEEFFVVAAWTMEKHTDLFYQRMKIVPSPRCVTVENWFLSLYRNAYAFLGNVLGLSHEFPAPHELFSGAVFVALYTGCAVHDPDPDYSEPPPRSVSMDDLLNVKLTVQRIISDNRHVLKNVIRGVFPFS